MKPSLKLSLLSALILLLITSSINLAIYVNGQTDKQINYLTNTSIPATMAILSLDTHISYAKHYLIQYVNATTIVDKNLYEFQLKEISKQISSIIGASKNSFEDKLYKMHWIQFSDALTALMNSQNQVLNKHNSHINSALYLDAFYTKDYAIFTDELMTMRAYVMENMNKYNLTLQNDLTYAKNILFTIFVLSIFSCIIILIYILKLYINTINISPKKLALMAHYINNNQFDACRKIAKENTFYFVENIINKFDEIISAAAKGIKEKQHATDKAVHSLKVFLAQKNVTHHNTSKIQDIIAELQNLANNFHSSTLNLTNQVALGKNSATNQINELQKYTTDYDKLSLNTPNMTQYIRIIVNFSLYSDNIAKDLKVDMQQTIKHIKLLQENQLILTTDMQDLHEFAINLKQLIHTLNKSIAKNQQLTSSNKKMSKSKATKESLSIPQAKHISKTGELSLEITDIINKLAKKTKKNLQNAKKSLKNIDESKNIAIQAAHLSTELQGAIIDTKDKLKGAKDVLKVHTSKSTLLKISLMQLNTFSLENLDHLSKIANIIANINSDSLDLQQMLKKLSNC